LKDKNTFDAMTWAAKPPQLSRRGRSKKLGYGKTDLTNGKEPKEKVKTRWSCAKEESDSGGANSFYRSVDRADGC